MRAACLEMEMKQKSHSRPRGTTVEVSDLRKEIAIAEIAIAGSYEAQLAHLSDKLLRLANSLRYPCNHAHQPRTDTWWQVYVSSASRELLQIAQDLPGPCVSVVEFEPNIRRTDSTKSASPARSPRGRGTPPPG